MNFFGEDAADLRTPIEVVQEVPGAAGLEIPHFFSAGKDIDAADVIVLRKNSRKTGREEGVGDPGFQEKLIERAQILPGYFRRNTHRAAFYKRGPDKNLRSHKSEAGHNAAAGVGIHFSAFLGIHKIGDVQEHPVGMQHTLGLAGRAGGIEQHGRGIFGKPSSRNRFSAPHRGIIHKNNPLLREFQFFILPELPESQNRFRFGILQHVFQALSRIGIVKRHENTASPDGRNGTEHDFFHERYINRRRIPIFKATGGKSSGEGSAARFQLSIAYFPEGILRNRLFRKSRSIIRDPFMDQLHGSSPPKNPFSSSFSRNCRI